jgi:alpha-beta hydrolase superfamily lysophospholipase
MDGNAQRDAALCMGNARLSGSRQDDTSAVGEQPWLFGHSDGRSIALLHTARFVDRVSGAIVLAPHILVEDRVGREPRKGAHRVLDARPEAAPEPHHDDPDPAF